MYPENINIESMCCEINSNQLIGKVTVPKWVAKSKNSPKNGDYPILNPIDQASDGFLRFSTN